MILIYDINLLMSMSLCLFVKQLPVVLYQMDSSVHIIPTRSDLLT